jgi:cob(I)alamin adenosyltransferase
MKLKKEKISLKEAREAGGKKYKEKIKKIIDDYKKLPDEKKHQIHVYYGYGKGKTTAAIGLAVRALGAGKKVAIVEFDKGYDEQTEHYSEHITLRKLKELNLPLEVYRTGCERMNKDGTFRFKNADEDFKEAQRALKISKKLITSGKQDLLILDEIIAAVVYHLLKKEDVFEIIDLYNKKRRFELVMTGHKLIDKLEDKVDLITEMRKVKHYFDKGIQARQGIEY